MSQEIQWVNTIYISLKLNLSSLTNDITSFEQYLYLEMVSAESQSGGTV